MPKAKTILVYKDYGSLIYSTHQDLVSWLRITLNFQYHIEFTDATSIVHNNHLSNDDIIALVMPGGHSSCYEDKIGKLGADKIKNFIANGGIYLGICGGAYYACQSIHFEKKQVSHSLNLISATAKGPLPDLTCGHGYDKTVFATNSVSLQYSDNSLCNMHYSGGCTFIVNDQSHEVLAKYETLNLPAAIRFTFGKGKVTLIGVHPESSPADFIKLSEQDYYDEVQKQHILDFSKLLEHSHSNGTHLDLSRIFLNDLL